MKYKYQKHLEEFASCKVGDMVHKGKYNSIRYHLAYILIGLGYAVTCNGGYMVIIKSIPADKKCNHLNKKIQRDTSEIALNFWINNYEHKYRDYIPFFYAVYLFIHKRDSTPFTIKDVMKDFPAMARSTVKGYLWTFSYMGVLKSKKRGEYVKVREIPGYVKARIDLKRGPKETTKIKPKCNRPIVYNHNRAKLYELAAKAGLYKQ